MGVITPMVREGIGSLGTWLVDVHHHCSDAVGLHAALGGTGVWPLGHETLAVGSLLVLGMLWTSVDAPAEPVRLPLGRVFATFVGWLALLAPLLAIALVAVVAANGLVSFDWAAVVGVTLFLLLSGALALLGFNLLIRCGFFERALVVVGTCPGWAKPGAHLRGKGALSFRIVDALPASARRASVGAMVRRRRLWGVIIAGDAGSMGDAAEAHCRKHGVRVFGEKDFLECWLQRVDIDDLRPGAVIPRWRARRARAWGHRAFDIILGLAILLFTLPVAILTAVVIKLDSRGPIFYTQERVGLNGSTFRLLKFRSMRPDAERGLGPQWAGQKDPRVTRVGRLLRLSRIDELPQLWNVLRGEMSLIGPRPERPYFVDKFKLTIPCYEDRMAVKPGITGWAQVNYRYGASREDARIKLTYDLYYVKHRSMALDLRIILATVRVILLQEGAR